MIKFETQYEVSVPGLKPFKSPMPYIGIKKALKYLNSFDSVYAANYEDLRNIYNNLSSGQAIIRLNHGIVITLKEIKVFRLKLDKNFIKDQQIDAYKKFSEIMIQNESILVR